MNLEEPDHPLGGRPSVSEREAAGEEKDPQAPSDHEEDPDRVPAPENQHEAPAAGDEEVSAVLSRKSRRQRRVVSEAEDDNEGDGSEREPEIPARSQGPPASPSKSSQQLCRCRRSTLTYRIR